MAADRGTSVAARGTGAHERLLGVGALWAGLADDGASRDGSIGDLVAVDCPLVRRPMTGNRSFMACRKWSISEGKVEW